MLLSPLDTFNPLSLLLSILAITNFLGKANYLLLLLAV